MSQKIDLKVEYTNKMAQENEALKAKLGALLEPAKEAAEALGFASYHLRGRASENMLMDMAEKADALIGAIGSTPAQCLAEIKARAVEKYKKSDEFCKLQDRAYRAGRTAGHNDAHFEQLQQQAKEQK